MYQVRVGTPEPEPHPAHQQREKRSRDQRCLDASHRVPVSCRPPKRVLHPGPPRADESLARRHGAAYPPMAGGTLPTHLLTLSLARRDSRPGERCSRRLCRRCGPSDTPSWQPPSVAARAPVRRRASEGFCRAAGRRIPALHAELARGDLDAVPTHRTVRDRRPAGQRHRGAPATLARRSAAAARRLVLISSRDLRPPAMSVYNRPPGRHQRLRA